MIVVTGAPGHIGNNLVRKLLEQGQSGKIRCMVLRGESLKSLQGLDVEIVEGDVRDPVSLGAAFAGADVVYHLASVISLIPGHIDLLEAVNVRGARNVAEACLRNGVRRLIYTSSIHALAEPPHGIPIDETASIDPALTPLAYSKSKARGTLEVLEVASKGLDAVLLFPTGVVGPYDFKPSEVGQMLVDCARGRMPVRLHGGYDFVDVRDVAQGHILACEKGSAGGKYILHGEYVSVDEIMDEMALLSGVPAPRFKLPSSLARAAAAVVSRMSSVSGSQPPFNTDSFATLQSNSLVCSSRAESELGFAPRPVRESLKDTVEWFRQAGEIGSPGDRQLR